MSLKSSMLQVRLLVNVSSPPVFFARSGEGICKGGRVVAAIGHGLIMFAPADWDDSQTDLAHLGGTAPGAAKSGGDKLWEDNWDDDDIEDDFSIQLRCA